MQIWITLLTLMLLGNAPCSYAKRAEKSKETLMLTSIGSIDDLQSIDRIIRAAQGLALMDAIMMPLPEFRRFAFDCNWNVSGREMLASMRAGGGDEYFLHFSPDGAAGKVLSGSGSPNAATHLNSVPDRFRSFKDEPAFSNNEASLFFWRECGATWQASPDGLKEYPLLGYLTHSVDAYLLSAEEYYERRIDGGIVAEVFETLSISPEQLYALNPKMSFHDLRRDIQEITGGT